MTGMCCWPGCDEITVSPAADLCRDHRDEIDAIRQATRQQAAAVTAAHEAQVIESDEVAA